ncbi:MAG: hypothetical protein ACQEP1_00610 [Nanobdellota archaeon]
MEGKHTVHIYGRSDPYVRIFANKGEVKGNKATGETEDIPYVSKEKPLVDEGHEVNVFPGMDAHGFDENGKRIGYNSDLDKLLDKVEEKGLGNLTSGQKRNIAGAVAHDYINHHDVVERQEKYNLNRIVDGMIPVLGYSGLPPEYKEKVDNAGDSIKVRAEEKDKILKREINTPIYKTTKYKQ